MLSMSVVNRAVEPRSGQTKDYKIDICDFFSNTRNYVIKSKTCFLMMVIPETRLLH